MATLVTTPIKTFISGETVTPTKLNELGQSAITLTAGTIVDADISASAAIALSKLATGALPSAITTTTANIVDASVTAAKLDGAQSGSAPIYGCRAWVNFDGTRNEADTGASVNGANVKIRASGNVASVRKNATGDYSVFFTTAMPDANYSVCITTGHNSTTSNALIGYELNGGSRTASAVRVAAGNNEADVFTDPPHGVNVQIFG